MKTTTNTFPEHFMVTHDGSLYDTRSNRTVREEFSRQYEKITMGSELRATLRAGDSAWPGGYPLYFITSDGCALSFESARKNLRSILESIRDKSDDGWRVIGCAVNWEDAELYCDHSGARIPSAYAEV